MLNIKSVIIIVLGILATTGLILNLTKHQRNDKIDVVYIEEPINHPSDTTTEAPTKKNKNNSGVNKPVSHPNYEPFWDFFYGFISHKNVRQERFGYDFSETEIGYLTNVLINGDFIKQDSLKYRWKYTVQYKNSYFVYHFINNDNGKWYLAKVDR